MGGDTPGEAEEKRRAHYCLTLRIAAARISRSPVIMIGKQTPAFCTGFIGVVTQWRCTATSFNSVCSFTVLLSAPVPSIFISFYLMTSDSPTSLPFLFSVPFIWFTGTLSRYYRSAFLVRPSVHLLSSFTSSSVTSLSSSFLSSDSPKRSSVVIIGHCPASCFLLFLAFPFF